MQEPPDYGEDVKLKLRFDKYRPQDHEGRKFDRERKDMQAQLSSALQQQVKHQMEKQLSVKQIIDEEKRIIQDRV